MKDVGGTGQSTVRKRILQEALRLFSAKGFEGASLQSIADAVGVQKPSLIHYFPTKEDLRREVMESIIIYWRNKLPTMLTANVSGEERLASTLSSLIEFFREDVDRARLMIREILDRPNETSALLEEHVSPWVRLIGEYLRMGQKSGLYKSGVAPEAFIVQVTVMVIGGVALGNVTSALAGLESNTTAEARIKELIRIVQTSLYADSKP